MRLKSNYDNRLVGVGGVAKAGVANGNIIICKHDSKLKRPNMFQKSLFEEEGGSKEERGGEERSALKKRNPHQRC